MRNDVSTAIVGGGIGGLAAALSLLRAGLDVKADPQVRSLLGAVDDTFVWALFDRKPMARWSVGTVTLLGDAWHAMLPFMAQGAAQAIEDGATLAVCLSQADVPDVPEALRRYEATLESCPVRIQCRRRPSWARRLQSAAGIRKVQSSLNKALNTRSGIRAV